MQVRGVVLLGGLVLLAGCHTDRNRYSSYDQQYSSWTELSRPSVHRSSERPRLNLTETEIENALANHRTQEAQRQEALVRARAVSAKPLPTEPPLTDVDGEVQVRSCYQIGAREAAEVVIGRHENLYTWDQASQVIEISATFKRGKPRSTLALSLTRKRGVTGDLVIAIPPGTYAAPVLGLAGKDDGGRPRRWTTPEQQRRFKHWPAAQDLALLRAPVLRLDRDQDRVVTHIPVACASFRIGAPKNGQPMVLDRFQPGSKIDRLMIALCSGPAAPSADTQLAVWLARDDLAWNQFVAKGGRYGSLMTFDGQRVLPRHGAGAGRLLLEAGIDPRNQDKFFRVTLPAPRSPRSPAPEDPRAEPAPPSPPLTPAAPEPAPTTAS